MEAVEPARWDAVRPLFVLLNLLERNVDQNAKLSLRQAALQTDSADAPSDFEIRRIRSAFVKRFFHHGAPSHVWSWTAKAIDPKAAQTGLKTDIEQTRIQLAGALLHEGWF